MLFIIFKAIQGTSANRNHIILLQGTYPSSSKLIPQSNVIIEGGFNNSFVKTVGNGLTNVVINPQLESANIGARSASHFIGMDLSGKTQITMSDFDLQVQLAGATGQINNKGISIYGIRANGISNVEITRLNLKTGDASGGAIGANGAIGATGAPGQPGCGGASDTQV
jgi:hypothetical protein